MGATRDIHETSTNSKYNETEGCNSRLDNVVMSYKHRFATVEKLSDADHSANTVDVLVSN